MRYTVSPLTPVPARPCHTMRQAVSLWHSRRKFRVLFIYPLDEIKTLAAQLAYTQGAAVTDADPTAAPATSRWMDVAVDENAAILLDTVNLAVAEVEDALSAISAGQLDAPRSYDVHLEPRREIVSEYIMGAGVRDSSILHLQLAIRQYLISSLLARWAALTRPEQATYWTTQAAAQFEDVRDSGRRCQSIPTTVPKYPPF